MSSLICGSNCYPGQGVQVGSSGQPERGCVRGANEIKPGVAVSGRLEVCETRSPTWRARLCRLGETPVPFLNLTSSRLVWPHVGQIVQARTTFHPPVRETRFTQLQRYRFEPRTTVYIPPRFTSLRVDEVHGKRSACVGYY